MATRADLPDLLALAADPPDGPLRVDPQEGIVRGRRRHRRRVVAGMGAGLTAVVTAAIVVPLTVLPGPSHEAVLTATPSPAAGPDARVLSYRHVSVTVPPGWTTGKPPPCRIVTERSVTIGPLPPPISCPAAPEVDTGINVVFYNQGADTPSSPTSARWAGQPARTTSVTQTEPDASGNPVTITTYHVSLPLLGANVTAQARTPAEATALLDRVTIHPAASLDLPTTTSSLQVSVTNTHRPSRQPDTSTSQPPVIAALLQALRAAPLLPTSSPICDDTALPVAQLTIPAQPIIQVRLGGCNEVVSGNGTLARATPQLKAALAAIVDPNILR